MKNVKVLRVKGIWQELWNAAGRAANGSRIGLLLTRVVLRADVVGRGDLARMKEVRGLGASSLVDSSEMDIEGGRECE